MHTFWTILLGIIALAWVIQGTRACLGMSRIPSLADAARLPDDDCSRVSILFAARDEAAKLPAALATMLTQDYPRYEVVAVNDRSRDATPRILDEFGRDSKNLRVVHIGDLPNGWLGKPHALYTGFQHATGQWLVFTDADVRFAPDALRRAMSLARANGWDHLTLLASVELEGFWEATAVTYLGLGFVFGIQPWQVSNPRSGRYMGVGAFQLLRRSTYEAVGAHRRLAMEVVDDMKLGKLVKQGGFRSAAAHSLGYVRVRWHDGLRNIAGGLTKNLFAGCGFSVTRVLASVAGVFGISILPFLALLLASGIARLLAGVAVAAALIMHALLTRPARVSPLYALTQPLGAAIFCYMLLRSTLVTLWRRGIVWRDTFYPLAELRRGCV